MDWRAALLQNWPYKLAAVTLSILLWFNVTVDEEERQEQPVRTRLDFQVTDSAWVAAHAPDEVMAIFQGRRRDLFALINQPVIRKVIDQVTDSVMSIELDPDEVVYDRELNVRPVEVRPSAVELRLERLIRRTVPVLIDLDISAADGFVAGRPIVRPESVEVRGARSEVESITHLQTARAPLRDLARDETRQLPLVLPEGLETVTVDPSQVLVTVEVDSLAVREMTVPVRLSGPGAGAWTSSPSRVSVTLRGALGELRSLSPEDVRAVVTLSGEPGGQERFEVEILLPEGLSEWTIATAEPPVVTVTRRGDGG